jgi:hypothetical protein
VDIQDLLVEEFGRIRDGVRDVVYDLPTETLQFRPDTQANSIAWLVWHLTRVQDDHVAAVAGIEQIWLAQGWRQRFDLPFDALDTGYGHDARRVGACGASASLLTGYHDAVYHQTTGYVAGLAGPDLDRIVDEAWDPPVSLGVRLVSVVNDDLQHVGQAAYVRGLWERDRP